MVDRYEVVDDACYVLRALFAGLGGYRAVEIRAHDVNGKVIWSTKAELDHYPAEGAAPLPSARVRKALAALTGTKGGGT